MNRSSSDDFLRLGPCIRVLPIVHGSGDYAVRVRADMLERSYDCLAVPLPPSFQENVETAIQDLPVIGAVLQRDADDEGGFSYVPIDPCQGVIAAIRLALGEHIPRAFIDRESPYFEAQTGVFPDPYALKRVSAEGFAAAVLPAIPPPQPGQHQERLAWMAHRLRELERRHRSILFVCSLLDWPWIRDAYMRRLPVAPPEEFETTIQTFTVHPRTLIFLLGELPFLTGLYERAIEKLEPDESLSVDGIKELVLEARDFLLEILPRVGRRITPQLLSIYFRYLRNLCLLQRRLTPDLYSLVVAAQQTAGDDFACAVAEMARTYHFASFTEIARILDYLLSEKGVLADKNGNEGLFLRMGIEEADVPGWGVSPMVSRLPGRALTWRSCELRLRQSQRNRQRWQQRWNPYGQCSWPPEDQRIESFQRHVRAQATAMLGADLVRSEKFTTSVMDGLDMRETLRHWHTGDIYVKIVPPSRGAIEVVVFLFDVPADPRRYPFRATWFAEHDEESTLAYFATDPFQNLVGPGVAQAEYGGALFLFPPRPIPNIWDDPRLNAADTLEERLLSAALFHSRERHIALVSPKPPPSSWRRLAHRYGRKLVHLPLKRFSGQTVERLRRFHVLNGVEVRSYAADFIRDS